MLNTIIQANISDVFLTIYLLLLIFFFIGHIYFFYKYESYIHKKYGEKAKDFTIIFTLNPFVGLKNLLNRKEDDPYIVFLKSTFSLFTYILLILSLVLVLLISFY
jgi:hypothetical protein